MDLEESSLLYRQPALYEQLRFDPGHIAAKRCAELIDRHGPAGARTVLDLGCGTGADLAHLAERFAVVGVDLQPRMIAHGRQVRPGLDLRVGDLRDFRLGHPVDALVCLGNTLAYLHRNRDLQAAFATFAAHAHPGTVLIVQTAVAPTVGAAEPTPFAVDTPQGRAEVTVAYEWRLATQIETMRRHWRFADGTEARDCITRRVLFPHELERYLAFAGFEFRRTLRHPRPGRPYRSRRLDHRPLPRPVTLGSAAPAIHVYTGERTVRPVPLTAWPITAASWPLARRRWTAATAA